MGMILTEIKPSNNRFDKLFAQTYTEGVSRQKTFIKLGKAIAIAKGNVVGTAKIITNNAIPIPKQTIGIFSNASPELAVQYLKCIGIIFIRGSQNSHGAFVAREFGIPAIIDSTAANIKNGMKINLDGSEGTWSIVRED